MKGDQLQLRRPCNKYHFLLYLYFLILIYQHLFDIIVPDPLPQLREISSTLFSTVLLLCWGIYLVGCVACCCCFVTNKYLLHLKSRLLQFPSDSPSTQHIIIQSQILYDYLWYTVKLLSLIVKCSHNWCVDLCRHIIFPDPFPIQQPIHNQLQSEDQPI